MHNETLKRQLGLDKFLAWVALSSIFVSGLYIETKFGNLFFSYFLMVATYALIVARTGSFGLRKAYGVFFFLLVGVSCLGFLISGFNYGVDFERFTAIVAKIVMLVFFVLFFTTVHNLCGISARLLFQRYLEVASVFAVLGILQEVVFVASGVNFIAPLTNGAKDFGSYLGIAGLSVEPAFYACSLLPAGAYYVSNFTRTFKLGLLGGAVIGAILLSTSSLGYLGLFISAAITVLFGIKLRHIWVVFILLPLFGFGAYKVSQLHFFQMRMNDTIAVLSGAELTMTTGMNISTYSLAVNMSMSLRSLQDNYGFGTGFGTYSSVFDHYIDNYEMPNYRDDLPGRGSATSLFARLTAELGVASWVAFFVFFIWSWREIRRGDTPAISIAYAATLMIILLRMGEYYVNGVVLVFLMIYWLHLEGRHQRAKINTSINFSRATGHSV